LIEIREIKRHVRSYGKADPMRIDRDAAYKIEYLGALRGTAVDAMINRDLKQVETLQIRASPFGNSGTVADAYCRTPPPISFRHTEHCNAPLFRKRKQIIIVVG
jgi:hypothetical protein